MGKKDSQAPEFYRTFKAIVESRRSYKQSFSSEPVEPGTIENCIDVARWAPSAHNEQPWRFIVFYQQDESQQAIRAKMLDAMGERYKTDLIADGAIPAAGAGRASNAQLRHAPVLILAILDVSVMDAYPDKPRQEAELVMAQQSIAACVQTLLLALHAAGLKACWLCAPLFAESTIQNVLNLPETLIPQAFIAVGHDSGVKGTSTSRHDGRMNSSTRRPASEIILSPVDFLDQKGDDLA